jgi:hypothetical protein
MSSSNPFEESYHDAVKQHLQILQSFPGTFTESLKQSANYSLSEDSMARVRFRSHLEDCLNAMSSLSRISRDLEVLSS